MPDLRVLMVFGALVWAVQAGATDSSAAALPSDAELEASGARIGRVIIDREQIFDLHDPQDDNWLFSLADHLHKRTRESTVRAQLLFRSGDRYSRRLLDETARNMRLNNSFIREPYIRPVRYHDGLVDIEVTTHDVWTLQPALNYSRSGGASATGIDISDANFLGLGKYAEIGHGNNVDRSTNYIDWADPNVWGSHWIDGFLYSNNSDGTVWNVGGGLPFYSLETPYGGGGDAGDAHSTVRRYRLGQQYDTYDNNWRTADAYIGKALLVSDAWTERLTLGWRIDRSLFGAAPGAPPLAPLPQNRLLSYPFLRMQWVENDYQTIRNLALIARTEDLHFGIDAEAGLGYASPAFGSDRHSVIADAEISYGAHVGATGLLFSSARIYSRFEDEQAHDALVSASASFYLATSERTRLLLRASGDVGHALDGDHYLQLGGDTGLRGYPLRYQNGDERGLFTAEERLYTHWYLFRLVNVGAAAFYDMGRTWARRWYPHHSWVCSRMSGSDCASAMLAHRSGA